MYHVENYLRKKSYLCKLEKTQKYMQEKWNQFVYYLREAKKTS